MVTNSFLVLFKVVLSYNMIIDQSFGDTFEATSKVYLEPAD